MLHVARDLAARALDTARVRGATYADARDLWDFDAGRVRVPTIHLAPFTFTGTTEH